MMPLYDETLLRRAGILRAGTRAELQGLSDAAILRCSVQEFVARAWLTLSGDAASEILWRDVAALAAALNDPHIDELFIYRLAVDALHASPGRRVLVHGATQRAVARGCAQ